MMQGSLTRRLGLKYLLPTIARIIFCALRYIVVPQSGRGIASSRGS